ncbi:MAG: PA14 domain-containing protein, partial [Tepidisphaeraceae bacterium]
EHSGSSLLCALELLERRSLLAGNGLAAAYFARTDLTATRLARNDATIDFDWAQPPSTKLGDDGYSVRWVGSVVPRYSGEYRFYTRTQGGARLWVNKQQLVDHWQQHSLIDDSGTALLTAGQRYELRMEFVTDGTAPATTRLYWYNSRQGKQIIPQSDLYCPTLESNPPSAPNNLRSTYVTDTAVKIQWDHATDQSGIAAYEVYLGKARVATTTGTSFTRAGRLADTTYQFTVRAVDVFGVTADATIAVTTLPPVASGSGVGLSAEYFGATDLSQFELTRTDPAIDFSWSVAPVTSAHGDNSFAARWTGQVLARYSESYKLYTISDDGVRLWVNGQLLIDHWNDHSAVEDSTTVAFKAGKHYNIKYEYYQDNGNSVAQLAWSSLSQSKQTIPTSQLFPAFIDDKTPGAPTGLTLDSTSINSVSFHWNPATDNIGVTGYDVFRGGQKIGFTTATAFTDQGLSAGTTYSYTVKSIDGVPLSSASSPILAVQTAPPPARNAFSQITAQTFDGASGVSTSGGNVTDFDDGDWAKYWLDFGTGVNSIAMRLSVPTSNVGGRFELHLDSTNGPVLGKLVVQATGSYSTYYIQRAAASGATGPHDLYVVGKGHADLANLKWLQFSS